MVKKPIIDVVGVILYYPIYLIMATIKDLTAIPFDTERILQGYVNCWRNMYNVFNYDITSDDTTDSNANVSVKGFSDKQS